RPDRYGVLGRGVRDPYGNGHRHARGDVAHADPSRDAGDRPRARKPLLVRAFPDRAVRVRGDRARAAASPRDAARTAGGPLRDPRDGRRCLPDSGNRIDITGDEILCSYWHNLIIYVIIDCLSHFV